jgi:very-short-patch-repair endonuclease
MISCGMCGHTCAHLGRHIHTHGLTKEEYKEQYGDIVAPVNQQKINQNLSEALMNNPEERERRSRLLGQLNKREDFRKRASETAIKTSARKDIREQRSARLKVWREEDDKRFYKTCTKKLIDGSTLTKTKPEKWLQVWFNENYSGQFKYAQIIWGKEIPNKSRRKQIDFVSVDKSIWIELDGHFHFERKFEDQDLEHTQEKDRAVNGLAMDRNKILIRISYDQWVQSTGRIKDDCLEKVKEIIEQKIPGVYKIGREYEREF